MSFRHELLNAIENLSRRRGFVNHTSWSYGGSQGRYEYGPLGSLLKRNIAAEWWRHTVTCKEHVYGMDSSIVQHPKVWEVSGHSERFLDRMVTNKLTGVSFKASKGVKLKDYKEDSIEIKAPNKKTARQWRTLIRDTLAPGARTHTQNESITLTVENVTDTHLLLSGADGPVHVAHQGVLCPETNSPFFGEPWMYDGMQYSLSSTPHKLAVAMAKVAAENPGASESELVPVMKKELQQHSQPMRPELAQSAFTQWWSMYNSVDMQFPVSFAQIGKAFRNELSCGPFIYRLKEFEQMDCYHFQRPANSEQYFLDLTIDRLSWWKSLAQHPTKFRSVEIEKEDLAHYASSAIDIEYEFPWAYEEIESICNRSDFDLKNHEESTGKGYVPDLHESGKSYMPHCVESSTGLDRAVMAYLCDAYGTRSTSFTTTSTVKPVLHLDKRLAPIKVAVFPIVHTDPELVQIGKVLASELRAAGLYTVYDSGRTIGKRYVDHDEMGTPYCLTIDENTRLNGTVTIRSRDTTLQEPVLLTDAVASLIAFYM